MITPGLISAREADELNEMARFVRGLKNIGVVSPLRKHAGPDGQSIIAIDTSNFLRFTRPSNSGSVSGSGSSTDASPTIVLGTIIADKACIGGVEYITTMDLVSNDGYLGFENEQTRGVGCCGCGCACEPAFYRTARLTFANRTGDMVAALPDTHDVTLNTWFESPSCYWTAVTNPNFGNGAWAGQFAINPAPILYYSSAPQWIQFGLSAPNVGSTNTGVQTPGTGWIATPNVTSVNLLRDGACGSGYSRHVGRYSITAGGGESHPGAGEFDLYLDLIL